MPKRSLWKSYVRPLRVFIPPSEVKYTYQKNVFRYKYFNQIDFNNCIVCTSLSPLALAHARSLNEKVYFCEVQEWFYPPQPSDLLEDKTYLSSDQIHLQFIDDADACFRQLGVRFSDISRNHIKQWLRDHDRMDTLLYVSTEDNGKKNPDASLDHDIRHYMVENAC